MNRKKGFVVGGIALILTLGSTFGYNAFADTLSKEEKYKALKTEVEQGMRELEKLKPEQVKEHHELGLKVKEKSWELGQLKKEVDPDIEQELKDAILGAQVGLGIGEMEYRNHPDDPSYVKALEIVAKKRAILAQIEKNYLEKKKSPEVLLKELRNMQKIREK